MAGGSIYLQNILGNKRRKNVQERYNFQRDMVIYFLKQLEYPMLIFS